MKGGGKIEETFRINIRPGINILGIFKSLSYNFKIAFGEFIDNSTQSFFDHEEELNALGQKLVKVKIGITPDRITITDDAFGMTLEDFTRAITPASAPPNKNGRNQYGVGLKQAACWLGNVWSVKTTQYGSDKEYSTTVDVKELVNNNIEEVEVKTTIVEPSSHYTIITIKDLNRSPVKRSLGTLRDELAERHTLDLIDNKLNLIVKDVELSATLPKAYIEEKPDGTKYEWKKDVEFKVETRDGQLDAHGFVQVLDVGNVSGAGLLLVRNRRTIERSRFPELFGKSNSVEYQRMYGIIHLDGWPVSESKDRFDWEYDDLKSQFITNLEPLMKEIRKVAKERRVRHQPPITPPVDPPVDPPAPEPPVNPPADPPAPEPPQPPVNPPATKPTQIVKEGEVDFKGKGFKYVLETKTDDNGSDFIEHTITKEGKHKIKLNLSAPALKKYSDDTKCVELLEKIAVALVLSEDISDYASEDGLIEPGSIRELLNEIITR